MIGRSERLKYKSALVQLLPAPKGSLSRRCGTPPGGISRSVSRIAFMRGLPGLIAATLGAVGPDHIIAPTVSGPGLL